VYLCPQGQLCSLQAQLSTQDVECPGSNQFGAAISVTPTPPLLAVGAPGCSPSNITSAGKVFVYQLPTPTPTPTPGATPTPTASPADKLTPTAAAVLWSLLLGLVLRY
jgi:hypothetical protein